MNKKMIIYLAILIMSVLFVTNIAAAANITPFADTVFSSATPSLTSGKNVTFTAYTVTPQKSISVTNCWLEQKINNSWTTVCSLTPPSTTAQNVMVFSTTKSYASQIGTGTFRVWATFNADGHEVTRCSNERTF